MAKKGYILTVSILFSILIVLSSVNAQISVEKKAITDTVISEIGGPAEFELQIKNNGPDDSFEIYSLADVDLAPKGTFKISSGETKKIIAKVYPFEKVKKNAQYYTFVYKLGGQISGIYEDRLTIKIAFLADSFELGIEDVNPDSSYAKAYIQNKENFNFTKIDSVFSSALFSQEESFSLAPYEKKEFNISIDKNKTRELIAGSYSFIVNLNVGSVNKELKSQLKFSEKSSILTSEKKSGLIIYTKTIEKTNNGNLPAVAQMTIKKDIISRLFTSFEPEPAYIERAGFVVVYSWQKEILPGQSFSIKVKTNWLLPLLLIIIILIVVFLVAFYLRTSLVAKKKVRFVKTKTGILALKVTITLSAKKFVEKISVIDKIPALMKVYEKYEKPDKIDEKNKRVEWDIESLDAGETRMLSYVLYSKLGVIGKLELPPATIVYERNNKISEVKSNRAFFIAEPRERAEEE